MCCARGRRGGLRCEADERTCDEVRVVAEKFTKPCGAPRAGSRPTRVNFVTFYSIIQITWERLINNTRNCYTSKTRRAIMLWAIAFEGFMVCRVRSFKLSGSPDSGHTVQY